MLTIDFFKMPTQHPYGMLEQYTNAYEKENVLAYILCANITAGNFDPVTFSANHYNMVENGLLVDNGNNTYSLTEKAKGLLYSVYHKE